MNLKPEYYRFESAMCKGYWDFIRACPSVWQCYPVNIWFADTNGSLIAGDTIREDLVQEAWYAYDKLIIAHFPEMLCDPVLARLR